MNINKKLLVNIAQNTTCAWTKGYIACMLDVNRPENHEIARELMDMHGPNHKIESIKAIRNNFGLGLREAKAVVDEYFATGEIVGISGDDGPADDGPAGVVA